ncbi:MAG: efflux RND transporter permease subunit [Gammaproteobacteria bacterium]|nr:efflux RND transporter permease subunit [Gammaproteobacteria bacterium]
MFQLYFKIVTRQPYLILFSTLLIMMLLGFRLPQLTVSTDLRIFFSEDNPQLKAFELTEATYGRQDNVFFFIAPRQGDIFNARLLGLVHELTELGWQFPYSRRVNSLSNYQHTHAANDTITTEYLYEPPLELSTEKINRIKQITLNEIFLVNNLVAKDGRATGINILLNLPEDNQLANNIVTEHARAIVAQFAQRYPDVEIRITGSAPANTALGEAVQQDLNQLVITSYIIIILGLLFLIRSFSGTFITLVVISLSILGTMGIYAWAGRTLTPVAGFVPSIVMTIAVADSVHILMSYFFEYNQEKDRQRAIYEALRINVLPVFITTITTIIGVLMLNFSDSPPYRDLGNMVAIGVAFAYVFSMLLIPALLTILPVKPVPQRQLYKQRINVFADWVIHRRRLLLYGIGISVAVFTLFIGNNILTERWHDYFDHSFDERLAIEAVNNRLSGVHAYRYSIDTHQDQGINNPEYLKALDRFSQWYRQQAGVAYVTSISDTLKRLNKSMHDDDPTMYRLPDQRDLTAQYLLLYEFSLPLGLGLDNTINQSRSASQLVVLLHKTDSETLLAIDKKARDWAAQNTPELIVEEATGLDMIFANINHRNIRSLLKGTALALVIISLVLIGVLRSVRLGLISMLPNLAPAALAYGSWGLIDGEIDLSASVVITMTLGIVVDDTIHFLSKYLRARREKNLDAREGIRYAFNTVGIALTITTLVLVSGFLVLTFSHFSPTHTTGLLLAITLSFALLIDFLLLPPLLMTIDHTESKK